MTAPCWKCAAPAVEVLRYRDRCVQCLAALFRRLDPAMFAPTGMMLPIGEIRVDGSAYVECVACGATDDAGSVFTACRWCSARYHRELDWQRELTLTPPDTDADDQRYDGALRGWADRLAVAVEAGLITEADARRSWGRHVGGAVARDRAA